MRGTLASRAVRGRAVRVAMAALAVGSAGLLAAWPAGTAVAAPAAAQSASAQSAAPASARSVTAPERFHLTTDNENSNRQQVQATGPFTQDGYAVAGIFSSSHSVSRLVFRRGTVRLVTSMTSFLLPPPNTRTCKFTEQFSGSYVIRGGFGRYPHASGTGRYVSRIFGQVWKRHDGICGYAVVSFWQSTRTVGSLHL